MIPSQTLIDEAIKEERKEKKEMTSWYISGLGSCMRGRYLERLGNPPDKEFDERTLRVFSVGNIMEDWYLDLLGKKTNIERQVRVEDKELNVSGYADAVVQWNGDKEVLEVKSKNSKAFFYMLDKGEGANEQHKFQLWTYLYLLKIDTGRLVYLSKDDLTVLEYPIFLSDEEIKSKVLLELKTLNDCWTSKTLPPAITDKKDWRYKFCRYHLQCLKN